MNELNATLDLPAYRVPSLAIACLCVCLITAIPAPGIAATSLFLRTISASSAISEPLITPAIGESTLSVVLSRKTFVEGVPQSGGQQISGGYFEVTNPFTVQSDVATDSIVVLLELEQCTYGRPDRAQSKILGFYFLGLLSFLLHSPEAVVGHVQWRARVQLTKSNTELVIIGEGACGGKVGTLDRRSALALANRRAMWDLVINTVDMLNTRYFPKAKRRSIEMDMNEYVRIVDGLD